MASEGKPDSRTAEIAATLDVRPALPLAIGGGSACFLEGSCEDPGDRIAELALLLDEREVPLMAHGMPSAERRRADRWWAIVPLAPVAEPRAATLALRARLRDGAELRMGLGELALEPGRPAPSAGVRGPRSPGEAGRDGGEGSRVAICMATHDPPPELFARQIASIREQTHEDWVCVIADDGSRPEALAAIRETVAADARIELHAFADRLGYYRNFGRALGLAPPDAAWIALADQDDRWYPEKLAALLAAAGPGTRFAYGDVRRVRADGTVLEASLLGRHRRRAPGIGATLVTNTIPGAAAIISRELLDDALPLPPPIGQTGHDHWLALVALGLGTPRFVERPLQDWVLHERSVHFHLEERWRARRGTTSVRRRVRGWRERGLTRRWRRAYFEGVCRTALLAVALRERLGARLEPSGRRAVARLAAPTSARALLWLGALSLLPASIDPMRGRGRALLMGAAWARRARARARRPGGRPHVGRGREGATGGPLEATQAGSRATRAEERAGPRATRTAERAGVRSVTVDSATPEGAREVIELLGAFPDLELAAARIAQEPIDLDELAGSRLVVVLGDPRDAYLSSVDRERDLGDTAALRGAATSLRERLDGALAAQRRRLRWIAALEGDERVEGVREGELAADPERVAERLAAWLGVPVEVRGVGGAGRGRVREAPALEAGRWRREMSPEFARLFADELGEELAMVGLER